jgi:multiple antibiotic resistance protein
METFFLAFIPLFVAIDVFAVIPFFVALTDGLDDRRRRTLTMQATSTAFAIAILFLLAGKLMFSFLGITENDFRVGGGIVLLVLAVSDLLFGRRREQESSSALGVVPIGIPLVIGPAALTTILILVDSYGYALTIGSLLLNMLIVWGALSQSRRIAGVMGEAGSKAVAKVAALFLAAIAVMMIRSGITAMLRGL